MSERCRVLAAGGADARRGPCPIADSGGGGRNASLFAIDKETGERVGAVELPGLPRYGMSSWAHDGHQVILVQLNDGLAAFGLPAAAPDAGDAH